MATAALAYSGITVKMLADKRLDAQLQTMFIVHYEPGAVAHPATTTRPEETYYLLEGEEVARRRRAVHPGSRRCLLDRGRLHPRVLRDEGQHGALAETSAPGPPDRHSHRFERDWCTSPRGSRQPIRRATRAKAVELAVADERAQLELVEAARLRASRALAHGSRAAPTADWLPARSRRRRFLPPSIRQTKWCRSFVLAIDW